MTEPTKPGEFELLELATQLDLVAPVADGLVAAMPEASAARAEELTRELRRRYPPP